MEELFIFDVFIEEDDDTGVDKISLVRKPAIMENFIFMEEQHSEYTHIHLSDDEKRILTGPALIPNLEILRKDDDGTPYFIKYDSEQITQITQKFFKAKDQYSVNENHKNDVSGIYIYESWLTGKSDKSKELGFEVPEGTWMISMKVDNDEMWEGIKSGKYKGFSIEGLFKFRKASSKVIQEDEFFVEQDEPLIRETRIKSSNVDKLIYDQDNLELEVTFKDGSKYTYSQVDNKEFFDIVNGYASCKTEGSNKYGEWYVGKEPSVGAAVYKFLIESKKPYREGSIFQELIENNPDTGDIHQETEEKIIENMVSTILKDGNTIYTDAEVFEAGVEVYFMNGEDKTAVEAGDYELEDGSIFVVGEGSILTEIKAPEAPEETPEEAPVEEGLSMEQIKSYFEPLLLSIVDLIKEMKGEVKQSIEDIDTKVEKVIVKQEEVKPVDKKTAEEIHRAKMDYDLIRKFNKKF